MAQNRTGCIIMASGMGTRFGSNKLMAELGGRPIVEHVMDTALMFSEDTGVEVMVLTRWDEVAGSAETQGLKVLLHSYTKKSDVIRLGIEHAEKSGWDACIFVLGDQPLLRTGSIRRLYEVYSEFGSNRKVFRLGADGKPGSPVIFSRCHYDALRTLTGERGGMSLFGTDETVVVPAGASYEMLDVDTAEDLQMISELYAGLFT